MLFRTSRPAAGDGATPRIHRFWPSRRNPSVLTPAAADVESNSRAPPLALYDRWFTRPVAATAAPNAASHGPHSSDTLADTISQAPSQASGLKDEKALDQTVSATAASSASNLAATPDAPRRRFSFLSPGAIALFGLWLIIVIIVLAVTLPLTLSHRGDQAYTLPDTSRSDPTLGALRGGTNATGNPLTPFNSSDPLAYRYSKPPVRLALLTNFPDPSIYYDPATAVWWAYGTNGNAGILNVPDTQATDPSILAQHANIQVATSTDFSKWTLHDAKSDPLPNPGAWAKSGFATVPDNNDDDRGGDGDDDGEDDNNDDDDDSGDSDDDDPGSRDEPDGPDKQTRRRRRDLHSTFSYATVRKTGASTPLNALSSVDKANVWAPDVLKHPTQDKYLMYYSAAAANATSKGGHHCVGAAVADSPAGPFEPGATPVACPLDRGGAIDPVVVVDPADNSIYMVYKIDGNSLGHGGECLNTVPPLVPTPLMLQKMQPDGVTPDAAPPRQLLDRTAVDGPLIEAPAVVRVAGTWYMFYSSGCTRNPSYDVRYATAPALAGPWARVDTPLLRTKDYGLLAPGSVTVRWVAPADASELASDDADQHDPNATTGWKIAFHARVRTDKGGVRAVFSAGLAFDPPSRRVALVPALAGEPTS